jgi:hypothetical protein
VARRDADPVGVWLGDRWSPLAKPGVRIWSKADVSCALPDRRRPQKKPPSTRSPRGSLRWPSVSR